MKVTVPLFVVLLLAMGLGYLLGTESGRLQRDVILVKLGRGPESDDDAADPVAEGVDDTAETPAT